MVCLKLSVRRAILSLALIAGVAVSMFGELQACAQGTGAMQDDEANARATRPESWQEINASVRKINADQARNAFGADANDRFSPRVEEIIKNVVALYGHSSQDALLRYVRALNPGDEQNVAIVVLLPLSYGRNVYDANVRKSIIDTYTDYENGTTQDQRIFAEYQRLRKKYSEKFGYLDLSKEQFIFYFQASFRIGIKPSADPKIEKYRRTIGSLVGVPYKG